VIRVCLSNNLNQTMEEPYRLDRDQLILNRILGIIEPNVVLQNASACHLARVVHLQPRG
jgi:hypothetical protein